MTSLTWNCNADVLLHFVSYALLVLKRRYRVLVGKPEGKRPLGRPRRRWEDNIRMDLREVGCDPREWTDLAEDMDQCRAYVKAVMNLRVPLKRNKL